MIWAEQTQTSDFVYHSDRGNFNITINYDGTTDIDVDNSEKKSAIIHGLTMWFAWTIFGLCMIATNRWFSYLTDKMQVIHSILGTSILIISVVCTYIMVKAKGFNLFANLHTTTGTFCIIGVLLVSMFGILTNRIKNTTLWNSQLIKTFRLIHRSFAYFLLLASYVAIVLGVM